MSRLDHFLVLYRFAPEAAPFDAGEVRRRLAAGPWNGTDFHLLQTDPFLLAWKGPGIDAGADGERAAFLRIVGNPYNAATARPAEIAAGKIVAAGELDGAFAAFAFDPAGRQGTLLTDRFGLFPLYVHEQDGLLAYSTSLPLLLAARQPVCRIDPLAVSEMLALRMVLGDRTFLREVRLVPPATALHLRAGPPSASAYWEWSHLCPATTIVNDADAVHDSYALIEQAVLRGVPAGAKKVALPLGGGLDSRLLCAVLARHGVPVQAYLSEAGSDAMIAREVARTLGVPLRELGLFERPAAIPSAHEAIDCAYHVHQLASREMARRAAEEDGCEVLFDGLALDAVLGPARYAFRDNSTELAREMELGDADIDEASLDRFAGEYVRERVFPAVRASLEEEARKALDQAGLLAPEQLLMTNRVRKYTFGGCLANLEQLPGRFPCITTRLFEHAMRLPGDLRREHALFRRILCEQFPDLARIPWSRTGLPLDQYAVVRPPRWRPWLEETVRFLSRGRLSLRDGERFDVDLRNRGALKGEFLTVLSADVPALDEMLPADFTDHVVRRHLAGRNLGGLLQGLYTVKHFLTRFVGPGMAALGNG